VNRAATWSARASRLGDQPVLEFYDSTAVVQFATRGDGNTATEEVTGKDKNGKEIKQKTL
jgi:hypothetical protein